VRNRGFRDTIAAMEMIRRLRITGPPLALQIVGLLLGGLIVAQLVTLFLTLLLPPEPQPQYGLNAIAQALSGAAKGPERTRTLQRVVQSGPPAPSGPGWLTSEHSRQDLARLLGCSESDVQLYFFTPLPFAGTARIPTHEVQALPAPSPVREASEQSHRLPPGFMYADFQVAQAATGAFPGGGFPGGFPGGGFPGSGVPGAGFPGGGFPQRPPMPGQGGPSGGPQVPGRIPGGSQTSPGMPGGQTPGDGGRAPGDAGQRMPGGFPAGGRPDFPMRNVIVAPPPIKIPLDAIIPLAPVIVDPVQDDSASAPRRKDSAVKIKPRPVTAPSASAAPEPGTAHPLQLHPETVLPRIAPPTAAPVKPQPELPVPVVAPARGLFGLAPAPFVEGDFIAALRLANGQWAVVQPSPEPFPNSWQRRVLLWFMISFALVAPLGWLFARRLVRPITGFADAAEQLGRDPTAPILVLEGPAEVGRAAHAFNKMQSRLRSFVDDRTAMVGAISHDLRTPLTRLRFRIEDVPDELREGMLGEVEEMEQMISSVLAFIRDASEPGSREMLDLRSIAEDVVEDAVFVGKIVTLEKGEPAAVEVDPLGMRRLLGNLVENAVKYGDSARVRLFTDQQEVFAEIRDNGPGLPEEELERVFQPFYRAPAARASNKHGSGLGLAVCRSIARAHGGDVQLRRGEGGLVAQVRLPLAYGAATTS
jgi:two-component system, OmpR family, sensor kinase